MFRVKICGVTRVEDAELAIALGADFLGLNFYPASARCLELEDARRIADAVGDRVPLVAVTVNAVAPEPQPAKASPAQERLLKGPAFGTCDKRVEYRAAAWPTFRHDNTRSGTAGQPIESKRQTCTTPVPTWRSGS